MQAVCPVNNSGKRGMRLDYTIPKPEKYGFMGQFRIYDKPKTWNEARKFCRDDNAHLAIINTDKEALVLPDHA